MALEKRIRVCVWTGMDLYCATHTSTSKNSSKLITFALFASSIAFLCDLRTNPGGRACLYWQFSPFGHSQNQPNLGIHRMSRMIKVSWVNALLRLNGFDKEFTHDLEIESQ